METLKNIVPVKEVAQEQLEVQEKTKECWRATDRKFFPNCHRKMLVKATYEEGDDLFPLFSQALWLLC